MAKTKTRIETGQRLKLARQDAGLTQTDLAKLLGYKHFQQVANWEHGENFPPKAKFKKICKILKVDINMLTSAIVTDLTNKYLGI